MKPGRMWSVVFALFIITGLLLGANPKLALGQEGTETPEIEPELQTQIFSDDSTGYMIYFREKADLSLAHDMDWAARGQYVVDVLQATASRSQVDVIKYLDAQKVDYQAFWIDNVIVVNGSNQATFNGLMGFSEIEVLRARRMMGVIEPAIDENVPEAVLAVEPNISHVLAPDVWGMGITGSGLVVANIDTGVRSTHDALVRQYRGTATGNHDYNWLGAAGGSVTPVDDHGHGTHTMGTIVGEDATLTNQIGMAPGAQWIACDGCEGAGCPDTALLTCAQWVAAPYPIGDPGSPDPAMRPHAVNNSWGDCGTSYDGWYQSSVDAWLAAGIYPIFSNGNASNCGYSSPPGLNTVGNPARYGNVTGVGSSGESNGLYATHSNWGPTDNLDTVNPNAGWADLKPQVLAPGVSIRSSTPGNDSAYQDGWSGTSMSAPHVTGLVALIWNAAPCLVGDYAATETIIEDTATPILYDDGTGGGAHVPNYATGWGEINALAAVQAAQNMCGGGALAGTVTDSGTTNPLAGVLIYAESISYTFQTTTDAGGIYAMDMLTGTYDVSASLYGFLPETVPDVDITENITTTLDFTLTPALMYTADGTVTDATTGWPLYAQIDIDGYPGDAIWTDPVTGDYSISLPEGIAYTFDVEAWVPGYDGESRVVGPLTGDTTEDFGLDADVIACVAPGYSQHVDGVLADFEGGVPPAGWTVVDNEGNGVVWTTIAGAGESGNYTNGSGEAATVSSDAAGTAEFDTELRTNGFDATGWAGMALEYTANYQNFANEDFLDVDISTDGGATWTTVLSWNEDHGGFQAPPGEDVSLDLSAYVGSVNTMLRWHYYDPAPNDWEWYAQIDDVLVGNVSCLPTVGGLAVGNVYDDNTFDALNGAMVDNEDGYTAEAVATPFDMAVDDGFYTLFSPSGSKIFTATLSAYAPDVDTVTVVISDTLAHDFYLSAGLLETDPNSLHVTLDMGISTTVSLALTNVGDSDAEFEFLEIDGGSQPAALTILNPVTEPITYGDSTMFSAAGRSEFTGLVVEPQVPQAAVSLVLDDGSRENALGLTAGGQFIWLNRFTPDPGLFPFTLTEIQMYFGSTDGVNVGETLDIYIYEDTDGDGDPGTGAVHLGSAHGVTIQALDAWSVWSLPTPVTLYGPGDVLVAAVNRTAGTTAGEYPAAMDQTASQGRSWIGIYAAGNPADPPVLPADAAWGMIDGLGFPGNWMLRAYGATGSGDVVWLSEDPITGTVPTLSDVVIDVTFDAGVPEITQPGDYHATLNVNNDTPYGPLAVPVTMTVNAPATWGKLEGTVAGLGHCDSDPATLDEAEVLITDDGGITYTLTTDVNGYFSWWLEEANSPYTIDVIAAEHEAGYVSGVAVTGGVTTTVDFDLRWLQPCVSTMPASMDVTLELGDSLDVPMSLYNDGALSTTFSISEKDDGFMPASLGSSYPRLSIPYWDNTETAPDGFLNGILAWGTGADIPAAARYRAAGTTCDGQSYYVMGGQSDGGTLLNEAWHYDPASDTWTQLADLPVALMNFEAACSNEFVYLVGGYDPAAGHTNNFQIYDVAADSWTATTWANTRTPMTAVYDGLLYAFGGNPAPSAETWVYAPGAGTWTQLADMPTANSYGAAVTVGDYIYQLGGGQTNTVQRYDPNSDTWDNSGPQLQDSRMSALSVWYGDYIYVVSGGGSGGDVWSAWSTTEVYDASQWPAGSWAYDDENVGTPVVAPAGDCAANSIWGVGGTDGGAYYVTNQYLDDGMACNIGSADVPWLAEDPITGTLAVDSSLPVTVTFDAGAVEQPGEYYASLDVRTDDPVNSTTTVPVTMTVNPPATWGKLEGTVTGLGYCDNDPAALEEAEVLIADDGGITYTLMTDANGYFGWWFDEGLSPFEIVVTYPEHEEGRAIDVVLVAGQTTIVDFDLRWLVPCAGSSPAALEVDLVIGYTTTLPLTITNMGALSMTFELEEVPGGFVAAPAQVQVSLPATGETRSNSNVRQPLSGITPARSFNVPLPSMSTALIDVLLLTPDDDISDLEAALAGFTDLTVTRFLQVDLAGLDVNDLLPYGVVMITNNTKWLDNGSVDPATVGDALADYIDAGGKVIANNFAYDYIGWELAGRFITEGYGPFTMASTDYSGSSSLGTVHEPGHSIMDGISTLTNVYLWQNQGLASGATRIADWNDGTILVAANENVVGLNILPSDGSGGAGWTGDLPTMYHNAVLWLADTSSGGEDNSPVPWLKEDPVDGTVNADGYQNVAVTFEPLLPYVWQVGTYTATLNLNSSDSISDSIGISVTMNVIAPEYGVDLAEDLALTGYPGETATYELTVTNLSNSPPDTFVVVAGAHSWPTIVESTVVGPVNMGETATVSVNITIPADASEGAMDTVEITAYSSSDLTKLDTVTLVTTAARDYGVNLAPEFSTQSIPVGQLVTYTLQLTNTGELTDTIVLTHTNIDEAWVVNLPTQSFDLNGGESVEVIAIVTAPMDANDGDLSNFTLIATSSNKPVENDAVEITTYIYFFKIILPLIFR